MCGELPGDPGPVGAAIAQYTNSVHEVLFGLDRRRLRPDLALSTPTSTSILAAKPCQQVGLRYLRNISPVKGKGLFGRS